MLRGFAMTLLGLVVVASAGARPAQDPGVTPATVLLGGTVPLTREAAPFGSVGPGATAYFDHVNASGGVHGRRISYTFYGDAYNPALTVQLTRKLVEQDGVFAVFNTVGTANSRAVREYRSLARRAELESAAQSVPASRDPAPDLAYRLPSARARLPVPLRQQGVGEGERAHACKRLIATTSNEEGP